MGWVLVLLVEGISTSPGRHDPTPLSPTWGYQGGNRSRTRSRTTAPLTRDPSCGACRMDRLGGIGIHQCSEIVPHFHSLTRCIVTLSSQYTLCVLRVSPWLCWTLTVLFTRQPCPADTRRPRAATPPPCHAARRTAT